MLAFRESGLSRLAFARRLGGEDKVVRRILDPCQATAANRLHEGLRLLGRDLVVESTASRQSYSAGTSTASGIGLRVGRRPSRPTVGFVPSALTACSAPLDRAALSPRADPAMAHVYSMCYIAY